MMATIMCNINSATKRQGMSFVQCFAQQYNLKEGLKKFGDKGKKATKKELNQLHKQMCFTLVDMSILMSDELKKAVEAIILLTQKQNGTVKGQCVYNGKPTREWLSREEAESPTAAVESIFLT